MKTRFTLRYQAYRPKSIQISPGAVLKDNALLWPQTHPAMIQLGLKIGSMKLLVFKRLRKSRFRFQPSPFLPLKTHALAVRSMGDLVESPLDFGDGVVSDPIIEVSYPDYDNPVGVDGKVSLKTLVKGFHYSPGHIDQAAPVTLASWTRDNPKASKAQHGSTSPSPWACRFTSIDISDVNRSTTPPFVSSSTLPRRGRTSICC
jgi:hypothetical protein